MLKRKLFTGFLALSMLSASCINTGFFSIFGLKKATKSSKIFGVSKKPFLKGSKGFLEYGSVFAALFFFIKGVKNAKKRTVGSDGFFLREYTDWGPLLKNLGLSLICTCICLVAGKFKV